jgi:putative beta-lysine N-acetyltransferase
MPDVIEKLGNSLIQHGVDSDRIYLMKLDIRDASTIIERMERLAEANDYGKLFCKVPEPATEAFIQAGYRREAAIPKFFDGRVDMAFMSRFRKSGRSQISGEQKTTLARTLEIAQQKRASSVTHSKTDYHIRRLGEEDVSRLADLYRTVFSSYPFPVFDETYLCETMATHIHYFGAFDGDRLVAASSAETDPVALNAEMTDFATAPDHRRKGLAVALLWAMEADMKANGFATLYTIARAVSVGISVTFARCGYHFGGTLVNNTQISGRIESMNVWYKNFVKSD